MLELREETRRLREELKAQRTECVPSGVDAPPASSPLRDSPFIAPPLSPLRQSMHHSARVLTAAASLSPAEAVALQLASEASSRILFGASPTQLPACLAVMPSTEQVQ